MRRSTLSTLVCGWLAAAAGIATAQPAATPGQAIRKDNHEALLPDGTIHKGTLANATLIHDAHDGVFVQAVLLGMTKPAKEEMFVVQAPAGRVGAQCWRERWFLTDEKAAVGRFDLLFLEDGQGGATWVVEDSAAVPGGVIERTGDGERAAAMRALPQDALDAVVRADSERYIATAKAFADHAIKGRVHNMMALTSPLTIAIHGLESIHDKYTENYLPRFKNAVVEWDKEFIIIGDETGNRGIEVSGTLKGEKTYRIFLGVMREGGKHVVISLIAKKPAADVDARKPGAT
ncbi:MAG: hypothetical protein WCC69_11140 [Pirellulales bacterium]